MKTIATILSLLFLLPANAQVNVNTGIRNTSISGSIPFPSKRSKKEKQEKAETTENKGSASSGSGDVPANETKSETRNAPAPLKAYENYDFVPGTQIVFDDNFSSDMQGEFPARWKLEAGQGVVNKVNETPAFFLTEGNYVKVNPRVKPASYLEKEFTVEFDEYFQGGEYGLIVFFYSGDSDNTYVQVAESEAISSFPEGSLNKALPGALKDQDFMNRWHHVAIAYKQKQIKVYVDQFRVLVVPDCNCSPDHVGFGGIGSEDHPMKFSNVRIASGGNMNMLNEITKTGKFVTHGILFESGKAIIQPQSMGALREIATAMKTEPTLNLEIDGHTDSDGDAPKNVTLSQQRAEAVKAQLEEIGVQKGRLTCKGFGEAQPIAPNDTPEGKAKNRRVELIKK